MTRLTLSCAAFTLLWLAATLWLPVVVGGGR